MREMLETQFRKDSWSPTDDATLAQIVLRHVRQGNTQLSAFEEASSQLTRTSAACGFRWNSTVRHDYSEELKQAKSQRKIGKAHKHNLETGDNDTPATIEQTPQTTLSADPFEVLAKALQDATEAYRRLQRDYDKLRRETAKLEKKLEDRPQAGDLAALTELMQRARELGLLTMTEKNPAV